MGYRGKLVERDKARELRAAGMTVPDIADRLGVSRSSVSLWVRDVEFIRAPRRYSPNRRPHPMHVAKLAEIEELRVAGIARIGLLSEREFLMAGLALYAGEGTKGDGEVKFTNSDASMMAFFCDWFRRFFPIDEERLRVRLYLHEGLDLAAAITFWSNVTNVPPSQFTKPYRAVPDAGIRHNKHEHGCAALRYGSTRIHREIMGMIRALLSSEAIPG